MLVIARNSTFVYKGRAVNVEQVGRELGVQYILEGSVRKSGNRLRITAQLIDALDGSHIWAERYDRDMEDVFAIQDEIAGMIVANIPRRLEAANLERVKKKNTSNMAAYDLLLRGKDHHFRRTPEDNAQALEVLDQAIDKDPEFAQAYAWKACTLGQAYARGFAKGDETLIQEALTLAEKSRSLDGDDSEGDRILCEIHLLLREYDQSELHHERAYALNPNDPRIVGQKGQLMTWTGRAEEAIHWLELARRLDPYPPDGRADSLGMANFVARRYAEALKAYRLIGMPTVTHHANMAACHAMLEDSAAAVEQADQVRRMIPDFKAQTFVDSLLYQHQKDRDHHHDALRQAGLE
jgi:adenylate cyclase